MLGLRSPGATYWTEDMPHAKFRETCTKDVDQAHGQLTSSTRYNAACRSGAGREQLLTAAWAKLLQASWPAQCTRLERGLEGQLQLGAGDDDVGEVQQVHLQRVQHALARHDDALGLLLHRQRAHQRRHLRARAIGLGCRVSRPPPHSCMQVPVRHP